VGETVPATGWNRDPKAPMRDEGVVAAVDAAERRQVRVRLDGGWAVEAAIGPQQRRVTGACREVEVPGSALGVEAADDCERLDERSTCRSRSRRPGT
jgi:hypothetical protein